jgi:hypothetical protein
LLAYIAAIVAHPGYTQLFARDLTIPGIRVPLSTDELDNGSTTSSELLQG